MNRLVLLLIIILHYSCKKEESKDLESIINSEIKNIEPIIASSTKLDSIDLLTLSDTLKVMYLKNNYNLLWENTENRTDLINNIENSNKEGLRPSEYFVNELKKWEVKSNSFSNKDKINRDILFSNAFEKYSSHIAKGKLNPKEIYKDWDLESKYHYLTTKGIEAIADKKVASYFSNLKPQHENYNSLIESLADLEKLPETSFKILTLEKKIEPLDTVAILPEIKERLHFWGDLVVLDSISTTILDPKTTKAVERFQARHGLIADGIIGFKTLKALNKDKNYRKKQTISNLERWRWYPTDLGNEYLLVNLPDYNLKYIKDGKTVENRRVVVGKSTRKTPVLISKLSNFVFNPTWTVPPTIVKKDLTPSATRNRGYFTRTRITIFNRNGEVVSPNNWNPENAKNYRYVQKTGYNNSLGLVKFNFKNNHLVFLHDTNHRDYFGLENKALSSGCVRVEHPLDLAKKILENQGDLDATKTVDALIEKGDYKTVSLEKKVGIYLFYWTSWKSKNGLEFRDDIYNYDEKLYSLLQN